MPLSDVLQSRSDNACELCGSADDLGTFVVSGSAVETDGEIATCETCRNQMSGDAQDPHHWRCLSEAIWSEVPAVKVQAWRMLNRLPDEAWARDILESAYLEEYVLAWARAGTSSEATSDIIHRDSNGATLSAGDAVTLIKDLPVKGAGFSAKRGTTVRNISLVQDNAEHIEGRVNGMQIVILTKFVKRA